MSDYLVEVDGLSKDFVSRRHRLRAVDEVSFRLRPGRTLGLVGESGCGKSTLGRCILRLIDPTSGKVVFDSRNLLELQPNDLRRARRDMQIIFQDPFSSLNPRMRVREIVGEPLEIHQLASGEELTRRVVELLALTGLGGDALDRYPHEFSGGQRQRISIARALALEPKFIVCDEPVSALDVSIQAQILNLMLELQQKLGLTYLFISHDLRVIEHIADDVAIMYLGKWVEYGPVEEVYRQPMHPYTAALMAAIPEIGQSGVIQGLPGEVPSPLHPPTGCAFHPRCSRVQDQCRQEVPPRSGNDDRHWRCFNPRP